MTLPKIQRRIHEASQNIEKSKFDSIKCVSHNKKYFQKCLKKLFRKTCIDETLLKKQPASVV